jgi:crossover junction endodeoxyribonuclease RuvC
MELIVLGIDPGSITMGWALVEFTGNKSKYLDSGVLKFDVKLDFIQRLTQIKVQFQELVDGMNPDEIAFESLVFVKNPTSLIKLSQARGIFLACLVEKYENRIFEYSPNLVKSSAAGHGHADKDGVQKVLDLVFGKRQYATHDESDALAIALCHVLNRKNVKEKSQPTKQRKASKGRGLAASLAHKLG